MSDYHSYFANRTELVLGGPAMERLASARVAVFGLGGVGSWCAEALLRSGMGRLTLIDSDSVCATNANRQIQATSVNLGRPKAGELARRLKEIDPEARVEAVEAAFTKENQGRFAIESFDYVVDAIDSVSNKLALIELCLRSGKKFVSSMGAGARSDPFQLRAGKLSDTKNCSLARVVRQGLRKRRVRTDFLCVYSLETPVKPKGDALGCTPGCPCDCDRLKQGGQAADKDSDWSARKRQINGSLVQVTGSFGFAISSLILRDAAGIKAIPTRLQA
jgi:tRNA A37 threonylcarbamoyladenosine dehydratase